MAVSIPMKPQCSAVNPIYPYRTQAVRDLAWACFSSPLLTLAVSHMDRDAVADCAPVITEPRQQWLHELDGDPSALLKHLESTSASRVGLYFEALWHFYLRHNGATDLIAHNLPVRGAERTLGEFDCLYFCHERERYVHLELAVKYFMGVNASAMSLPTDKAATDLSGPAGESLWIGPNKRDRLDIKLQHMLDRQLQLADLPEAAAALHRAGIPDGTSLLREVGVRGYLFQPLGDSLATPIGHQADTNSGTWTTFQTLPYLLETCEQRGCTAFLILPRIRWLSPAVAQPNDEIVNAGELIDLLRHWFADNERPLLTAALDANGLEQQRFFVTPNDWADELTSVQ